MQYLFPRPECRVRSQAHRRRWHDLSSRRATRKYKVACLGWHMTRETRLGNRLQPGWVEVADFTREWAAKNARVPKSRGKP
jgi:hypothetical protein